LPAFSSFSSHSYGRAGAVIPLYVKAFGRTFCSIFKTSCSAPHPVLDQDGPDELHHPRIVLAVREIGIQRGETMLLAGFLHASELAVMGPPAYRFLDESISRL
jgi:hypothetical protein